MGPHGRTPACWTRSSARFEADHPLCRAARAGARVAVRRRADGRGEENGSGTDHGAAGCGFLIGTRAAGRMVGEFPGLAKLDKDGNLRATSDYRGVYGALRGDRFGVDPAAILPVARGIGRPMILK